MILKFTDSNAEGNPKLKPVSGKPQCCHTETKTDSEGRECSEWLRWEKQDEQKSCLLGTQLYTEYTEGLPSDPKLDAVLDLPAGFK